MSNHQQAVKTLRDIRLRLADRLADIVNTNADRLTNPDSRGSDPLATVPELLQVTNSIFRLDGAIACLTDATGKKAQPHSGASRTERVGHGNLSEERLEEFAEFVNRDQLESAAKLLVGTLRMSLDRAVTATRFFARASSQNPTVRDDLRNLCEQVRTQPASQCMRLLVTTFGLQAVESQEAIKALSDTPPVTTFAMPARSQMPLM